MVLWYKLWSYLRFTFELLTISVFMRYSLLPETFSLICLGGERLNSVRMGLFLFLLSIVLIIICIIINPKPIYLL